MLYVHEVAVLPRESNLVIFLEFPTFIIKKPRSNVGILIEARCMYLIRMHYPQGGDKNRLQLHWDLLSSSFIRAS